MCNNICITIFLRNTLYNILLDHLVYHKKIDSLSFAKRYIGSIHAISICGSNVYQC